MSFAPSDVRRMCKIALNAGAEIDSWDYGFSAGCRFKGQDKALIISEVFRSERDGYIGGRIITRELLDEWLKENKPK